MAGKDRGRLLAGASCRFRRAASDRCTTSRRLNLTSRGGGGLASNSRDAIRHNEGSVPMKFRNPLRPHHLVLGVGAVLWSSVTPVAAQDAATISVSDSNVNRPTATTEALEFIVSRSGNTSFPVAVGYQTQDNTANAGVDYTATQGVVIVPEGATDAKIQVPILANGKSTQQDFFLQLTEAKGPLAPELAEPPEEVPVGINPQVVISADINGDGRLDLVVLDDTMSASILLNTTPEGLVAKPSFGPRTSFPAGASPRDIVAADFNGDGRPDLAVTDSANDTVQVFFNLTSDGMLTPLFAPGVAFDAGAAPNFIASADFDGDGKPDLSLGNGPTVPQVCPVCEPTGQSVAILVNTTPTGSTVPTFEPRSNFEVTVNIGDIIAVDLDQDGRSDVVVGGENNRGRSSFASVLLNTTDEGEATPKFLIGPVLNTNFGGSRVAAVDLNGDGRLDVVASGVGGPFAYIALDSSPLAFAEPISLQDAEGIIAVDLDGDGTPELARVRDAASILLARANGAVADLNGDGIPELADVNSSGNSVSVSVLPSLPVELSKAQGVGTITSNASTDTTPRRFSLIDRRGVPLGRVFTSNAIVVRGINKSVPIMVTGGSYSINGGAFTSMEGTVQNGDRVRVRQTSADRFSTRVNAQLTIGSVSDTFTIKTRPSLLTLLTLLSITTS